MIYLIELGPRLDNSGLGVDLGDGLLIAYLKFADDIVLASSSESGLEELKCILEGWCFNFRMKISHKKTQVITPTNNITWTITDLSGEVNLLELQKVQEYTYLGVIQKLSVTATADKKSDSMVQRAKTYKNSLLRLRSTIPDKTDAYRAAWENVAIPSILYSADVLPVTYETIGHLDDIQHIVAKVLLGVPKSSTNLAALVELGMKPFHLRILEVKLRFYIKVSKGLTNCRTTQACMNLLKASPTSEYLNNLSDLLKPLNLSIDKIDDQSFEKLDSYHKSLVYRIFPMKTMRLMPLPISWWKKSPHVEEGYWSKSLSRFRTMNAGLGNRDTFYKDYAVSIDRGRVVSCPLCISGPNDEHHLVMVCPALELTRNKLMVSPNNSISGLISKIHQKYHPSDSFECLRLFLGQELGLTRLDYINRGQALEKLVECFFIAWAEKLGRPVHRRPRNVLINLFYRYPLVFHS